MSDPMLEGDAYAKGKNLTRLSHRRHRISVPDQPAQMQQAASAMSVGAQSTFIDWYKTGRLSPYLKQHRVGGTNLHMVEAAQPAGDCSDPPLSDLLLVIVRTPCKHVSDLGGGRFSGKAAPGDLFLIPPDFRSDITVHDPHVIRVAAISSASVQAVLSDARPGRDPFDFGRLHSGGFRNEFLLGLCGRLWDEAEHGDALSRLFADSAIITVVLALARLADTPVAPTRGGLSALQLRRSVDLITDLATDDIELSTLATEANLSVFHFARAFKQSVGVSPHRYQTRVRMQRAKALLEHRAFNRKHIRRA